MREGGALPRPLRAPQVLNGGEPTAEGRQLTLHFVRTAGSTEPSGTFHRAHAPFHVHMYVGCAPRMDPGRGEGQGE